MSKQVKMEKGMEEVKKETAEEGLQYTIVNHRARKALGLTWTYYCIIDSLYHLSHNPKRKGWCTQSNEGIADFLGCDEKAVRRAKEKGIEKGLLEIPKYEDGAEEYKKHKHDHRIRTTQKWYDATIINRTKCPNGNNQPDKMSECLSVQPDKMSNNKGFKDINKDSEGASDLRPSQKPKTIPPEAQALIDKILGRSDIEETIQAEALPIASGG